MLGLIYLSYMIVIFLGGLLLSAAVVKVCQWLTGHPRGPL